METISYPPRSVLVQGIGPSWFRLQWKPPLSDGNTPIYEYEISYSKRHITKLGTDIISEVVTEVS